jgi:sec-independent protein translocase protein TatA
MFGSIGFPEIIMIFVVVLLLFGPKKLPDFAKMLGKAIRDFRETVNEARSTIEEEIEKADITKDLKEIDNDIRDMADIGKPDIYDDLKEIDKDIKEIKGTTGIGKKRKK